MDDLDRLIDEAARQMAQRQPSEALAGIVMERVVSGRTPLRKRGLVWGAAAAAVAAGLVAFVGVNSRFRQPSPARSASVAVSTASASQQAESRPAVLANRPEPVRKAPRRSLTIPPQFDETVEMQYPLAIDPISPEPINVEPIEVVFSPIESLEIKPIEIAPISASND